MTRIKRILAQILLTMAVGALSTAQPIPQIAAGDRTSVDLTIYNQNLSLIREERIIRLIKGLNKVTLPEIPSTIDGTSLHYLSLTDPR